MVIGLFKNILILVIIGGILFIATRYIPQVKKQTDTQIAKVLGAKTASSSASLPLAESLKKDTKEQIDEAKKKAFQIKLGDIISTFGRLQKIPKDADALRKSITTEVNSLLKK